LADERIGALITVRLLVGAFEAGFYPTAVAYLSFFYPKFDLAVRVGLFYGQYAIAGAFSGSICQSSLLLTSETPSFYVPPPPSAITHHICLL
jgi:MFS family permease